MGKMNKELEAKLWTIANQLRGSMSSEEYMHVVIGILFLKHISEKHEQAIIKIKNKFPNDWKDFIKDRKFLKIEGDCQFMISEKSSWNYVSKYASDPKIGQIIDEAFLMIEKENPRLKGLFDKEYNSEKIDQRRLGEVVTEFSEINTKTFEEDLIGRIYEFFLGKFLEANKSGEFYTPECLVKLLTDLIEIKEGKLYDPCFGTGGMFIQSKKHMIKKGYDPDALVIYGQEFVNKTWKIGRINLLIHGFDIDDIYIKNPKDSLLEDQHKTLNDVDFALANPPFNQKKWGKKELTNDKRFKYGLPNNANYAWIQHILSKLGSKGIAAIILANGSLSTSGKEEEIRAKMLKDNIVDAIITLPDKLFYTTQIPACVWIINKNKNNDKVLMVNASEFKGEMLSKKLRLLLDKELEKIVEVYHKHKQSQKIDQIGFAKTVNLQEIKDNDYSFVPSQYVGWEEENIDKEALKKEVKELAKEIDVMFDDIKKIIPKVKKSLKKITK